MGTLNTPATRSQKKKILEYMQRKGSITPMDALTGDIRCMRLSARIADLKADGYVIETVRETKRNEEGHTVTYARYFLKGVS